MVIIPGLILDDEILNNSVESKIAELIIDTNKINVIIAGDSRAESQLIPEIIKDKTGFHTINIATSACDLVTIVAAIKKKYPSSSKIIFIIGASSWQINDGSIEPGYLSFNCFQKLNVLEKYMLYRKDLSEMVRLQIRLTESLMKNILYKYLKDENNTKDGDNIMKESGFLGLNSNLNTQFEYTNLKKDFDGHPFYKNINNNGIRWSLFQKAIRELGNMNSLFIIYQPPSSPFWKENTARTFIDIAEIDYSNKLSMEVRQYSNISFYDYYNNDIPELNDSMYSDIQHLNLQGAEVFSVLFAQNIMKVYQKNILKIP